MSLISPATPQTSVGRNTEPAHPAPHRSGEYSRSRVSSRNPADDHLDSCYNMPMRCIGEVRMVAVALGAGSLVVGIGLVMPGVAMAASSTQLISSSPAPSADWSCALASSRHQSGQSLRRNCHEDRTPSDNLKEMGECGSGAVSGGRYLAPAGPEGVAVGAVGGCIAGSTDYELHHDN